MNTAAVVLDAGLQLSAPDAIVMGLASLFCCTHYPYSLYLCLYSEEFILSQNVSSCECSGFTAGGMEGGLPSESSAFGDAASSRGVGCFHSIVQPVSTLQTYLTNVETEYRKAAVI